MPVILSEMTPTELRALLGARMRALRLSANLDQQETALRAGISVRALRNLEAGTGSSVDTLLRVLKALDALAGLAALAPEPTVNPLALLRRQAPQRRVRRPRKGQS